ncbi:MAG: exosome complex exonuclease Rrp41 [Candidatus Aenigmarchaeota archaeon]|nr:exosome complex exonuclease Rrp41 [Candidatus Aenigmarchaeota archaeon]
MKNEEILLIKDGKRLDGRLPNEMRPVTVKAGILRNADGSALFAFGKTIVVAGVYGPKPVHPRHLEDPERAILRTIYSMAPFSTEERIRPGPSRRSTEISMVVRKALEPVLFLEEFPKTMIDVYIEILQADASTRCAAINAASVALADAGIPMRDLISSVSVGKINGQIVVDIAGKEDEFGDVDFPIAYYPRRKQITLMQMDGIITKDEIKEAVQLAIKGCEKIYEKQKESLRKEYTELEPNL